MIDKCASPYGAEVFIWLQEYIKTIHINVGILFLI
jgi:hypothetical protein